MWRARKCARYNIRERRVDTTGGPEVLLFKCESHNELSVICDACEAI